MAGSIRPRRRGCTSRPGWDVTIKMGGPQVNNMQLLAGGAADIIIGFDIQMLSSIEKGAAGDRHRRSVPVRPARHDDA